MLLFEYSSQRRLLSLGCAARAVDGDWLPAPFGRCTHSTARRGLSRLGNLVPAPFGRCCFQGSLGFGVGACLPACHPSSRLGLLSGLLKPLLKLLRSPGLACPLSGSLQDSGPERYTKLPSRSYREAGVRFSLTSCKIFHRHDAAVKSEARRLNLLP
jgi:hypothetical protein